MTPPTSVQALHLHTYFLFPFSLDKQAVVEHHPGPWAGCPRWIDGLDQWIAAHQVRGASPVVEKVGAWQRAAYTRFDMDSPAYQDMVFFHPFVRRVFFDTTETSGGESLLRCYQLPLNGKKLFYEAEDARGRGASVEVTDLRLFLFANGIGILSIGVEAASLPMASALWVNETMRKVYPSSGRQVREGRFPSRMALVVEHGGVRETVTEERFTSGAMIGFLPPLSKNITGLLYFADYMQEEFEPVLDERMIVYTYLTVDPASAPEGFTAGEDYQILLSRVLYVDRQGADYRYERGFTKAQMFHHLYRRWAHQGTYYGFTSYSNITVAIGQRDCDEHLLKEGFLIHRMFDSRYYLMAMVALFYRATLLHFAERTALVSKQLFLDQEDGKLTGENIRLANDLRAEFLHFSNYWHFDELANKDEEIEHFTMQCRAYRTESMKNEIEAELDKLNDSLHSYFQFRNTEAVNRLAMLSMIFGAGALLTGFFGMNFGREFGDLVFNGGTAPAVHYASVALALLLAVSAFLFGLYLVAVNWQDYKPILTLRRQPSGESPVLQAARKAGKR